MITLGVADLGGARAFYDALGWTGEQQSEDEVCVFQAAGMVFGVWTALGGPGAPGSERAHHVRELEEISRVREEAERTGGSIGCPAAMVTWGGTSGAFVDRGGYVWEVVHHPGWTITDDGSIQI